MWFSIESKQVASWTVSPNCFKLSPRNSSASGTHKGLWRWCRVDRDHWNLSHCFCKNFNVFSWSAEILLWLNFQSWKHPVKLNWQMQILQKICRGRSSLLCFDIFPCLPTARAWDHLRDILVCSCEVSTSAASTTHIMRSLSCNSDQWNLLLWAGTCCCRCWWWHFV